MKSRFWIFALVAIVCSMARAAEKFPPVEGLPLRPELPDALTMFNGKPVATKNDWFKKRVPELKELFQHYEYGYFPPPVKIKTSVDYTDKNSFGGKATLKLVTISFARKNAPQLHLMLATPNARKNPAPLFLGLNFSGNHSLVENTNVPLPSAWMNSPRMASLI